MLLGLVLFPTKVMFPCWMLISLPPVAIIPGMGIPGMGIPGMSIPGIMGLFGRSISCIMFGGAIMFCYIKFT
jgi:hypothetical protein